MTGGAGEYGTDELRNRYIKDTPGQSLVGFKRHLDLTQERMTQYSVDKLDPKKIMMKRVLDAMYRYSKKLKGKMSIEGIAFDIIRQYNLPFTSRELARMYEKEYGVIEEAPSMSTSAVAGAGDDSSTVVVRRRKKKQFDVPHHIFKRFEEKRKMKYERWANLLDSKQLYETEILEYIRNNRTHDIVLRSQETYETVTITPED